MEWKDVVGFEGLYRVSEYGDILSIKRNKLLSQRLNKGYPMVKISKNGKQYTKQIHRLVAIAFIPNLENKPEVNHLDEVKTNNHISNLSWVTAKENSNWGTRNEKVIPNLMLGWKGKIRKKRPVIEINLSSGLILCHKSAIDVARERGITNSHIYSCLNNAKWCKTAYGSKWFYERKVNPNIS